MYTIIDLRKTKLSVYQELFNLSKEPVDAPLRLSLAGLDNTKMTDAELIELLTNLSETIKELSLNVNVASVKIHISGYNYEEVQNKLQLLGHFSADIPQVEVYLTGMHMINEELIKVISALSIIRAPLHLSLSNNMVDSLRFCEKPLTIALCQAAAALPTLQSLSFSDFDFTAYSTDFIVEAFRAVSTEALFALNLENTRIDHKPVADIKRIIAAIPENVTCLTLGSWWTNKTSDELIDIFSTLRGTKVTKINSTYNFIKDPEIIRFIEEILTSNKNAQKLEQPGLMLRQFGLFNNVPNQTSTSVPPPTETDALTYAAMRHLKDKAMTPIDTAALAALHEEIKLLQLRVEELEAGATETSGVSFT